MHRFSLLVLACIVLACASELCLENTPNHRTVEGVTRRRKRSLSFPKGSAFVLTITLLKAIQVQFPSNWNLDLEFDMIWPIPAHESRKKPYRRPHRRHRRELYSNFELAIDSQGLPGSQCVLRTLCEAKLILSPPGVSLVEDVLRVVFSYPQSGSSKIDAYDRAYMTKSDCDIAYPCPFSLLQLVLNYGNGDS